MTVAELIEELKKYPQNLQVATPVPDPSWGQPELLNPLDIRETAILTEGYSLRTGCRNTLDVLSIGY